MSAQAGTNVITLNDGERFTMEWLHAPQLVDTKGVGSRLEHPVDGWLVAKYGDWACVCTHGPDDELPSIVSALAAYAEWRSGNEPVFERVVGV